ncbi:MAG: SDR family NAD(P)-dependent oxidoreductase [Planctomycetales bacterium]|nr:SDR family NAD(P)-dependent oxidoreductase [Planctomycetales bacterium]
MAPWGEKVVVVTGGSAGLGLAIAERFARAGSQVVMVGRDAERLRHAADNLATNVDKRPVGIAADVTQQCDVESLFAQVHDQFGQLDVLVNNAGRSSRGAVLDTTVDYFAELLDVNFLSVVHCTRAAAEMLLQSRGHLVNIGSLAAKQASRYLGAYPVSKFAVAAYTHQLRLELSDHGLHVLLVCPGPIERPDAGNRYDSAAAGLPESAKQPGGGVKLKRIAPEKLAAEILRACERRQPELVVPAKARWLFAISQLWPAWGDWILSKKTKEHTP